MFDSPDSQSIENVASFMGALVDTCCGNDNSYIEKMHMKYVAVVHLIFRIFRSRRWTEIEFKHLWQDIVDFKTSSFNHFRTIKSPNWEGRGSIFWIVTLNVFVLSVDYSTCLADYLWTLKSTQRFICQRFKNNCFCREEALESQEGLSISSIKVRTSNEDMYRQLISSSVKAAKYDRRGLVLTDPGHALNDIDTGLYIIHDDEKLGLMSVHSVPDFVKDWTFAWGRTAWVRRIYCYVVIFTGLVALWPVQKWGTFSSIYLLT